MTDPKVAQTTFSEDELGIEPPEYTAMLLTEIRESHGPTRIHPGDVIRSELSQTDETDRAIAIGTARVALAAT